MTEATNTSGSNSISMLSKDSHVTPSVNCTTPASPNSFSSWLALVFYSSMDTLSRYYRIFSIKGKKKAGMVNRIALNLDTNFGEIDTICNSIFNYVFAFCLHLPLNCKFHEDRYFFVCLFTSLYLTQIPVPVHNRYGIDICWINEITNIQVSPF